MVSFLAADLVFIFHLPLLFFVDALSIFFLTRCPTPEWLPVTYNLKTEIPAFVSHFQRRARLGLDNHWIVKAWNLARGLDMHISPHLHHILRLPLSGPKIAQK